MVVERGLTEVMVFQHYGFVGVDCFSGLEKEGGYPAVGDGY